MWTAQNKLLRLYREATADIRGGSVPTIYQDLFQAWHQILALPAFFKNRKKDERPKTACLE